MLAFAKIRQYRSAAVFVLLGWIFAFAVGSVYGCVQGNTDHHARSAFMALVSDSGEGIADHAGEGHDPCQIACDLQASPVVKEAAGQAPDIQFLAYLVTTFIPVFDPLDEPAPLISGDKQLPDQHQSLRTTRLNL